MKDVLDPSTGSLRVKKTVKFLIIALALVASSCAEGEPVAVAGDDAKTAAETSTTTSPALDTTVATTTSLEPSTTTTTSTTSTTVVTSEEFNEAQALFASIKSDADIASARVEGLFEIAGLDEQEAGLSEMTMVFSTAFNAATGDSSMLMEPRCLGKWSSGRLEIGATYEPSSSA